jgi:hypothetical protein
VTDDASRDGGKDGYRRRIDGTAALVALATVVALSWLGWRFGPGRAAEPPGIGAVPPPLRLLDADTGEPLVLLGLKGKVVWVAFWSAASASGRSDLSALGRVWDRLKARSRFAMVAVAVDGDPPDRLREALAASRSRPPTYRATPETRRAFGATGRDLPIHLLIDETGRVAAVARGGGPDTLARLAEQAERRLDELNPLGDARFARSGGADAGPPAIFAGLALQVYK